MILNQLAQTVLARLPVQKHEWPKFIGTSMMMICTIFIYSLLRNAKDTLVISQVSAELVSTIKLYGVLPSAVLAMLVYTKLVDVMPKLTIYHAANIFFVLFVVLFTTVLYPNASSIHPDLSSWSEKIPYLKYLFLMVSYWSYSLFFIFSELWGGIMFSLLFWQFANQTTAITEAKRFYPLFGLTAQLGLILAGVLMSLFSAAQDSNNWQTTLNSMTVAVVLGGILLSLSLWYLTTFVIGKDAINNTQVNKKTKEKMGVWNSLKYIFSSKYLGLITLLILTYGVSINLVEGVWKKMLSVLFVDASSYTNFTGKVQVYRGIATVFAMLSSSYLLRVLSWRAAAIFTPIMILITGIGFFLFVLLQTELEAYIVMIGTSTVVLSVYFGAAQDILSKATRYSFFDPTKEIAYIPLDDTLKAKGKSAADIVGGRLGKSGGAVIQWVMLSFIPGSTLLSLAPNLFGIFTVIMVIWIYGVFALSKEFEKESNTINLELKL